MHLKRISIQGFKSFADHVDFEFSRGVTCIVGPNGCGKSNVVDAFKWVLGEQSAKLLRGRQMTDMIFNGSTSRRSSGMAQVDLLFDNSDRSLPLEFDEVCVTRKLYRSGESEYLLNNETARLKDIKDLFLDSGVGADTYSVIEQGRVDGLLSSSPIERREIFEEAAGIGKYKVRKREAQRKLERTQQNLLRVADIVDEVEKRLRSVKLQAGKARSFQAYDARLKELRASFSLAEFHRLTETMSQLTGAVDQSTDESTSLRTNIDRNEVESIKLADSTNKLNEELSATEQELARARSDIATHEERISASRRRVEEQEAALARIDVRVEQLRTQRDQYDAQLSAVQEEAEVIQHDTHVNEDRMRVLIDADHRIERELTEARSRVQDVKDGLIDLVRRATQLRNEVARLDTHSQSLKAEHNRLGERDAAIREELAGHLGRKSSLESRLAEIDGLIETESARLRDKTAEAERVAVRRSELAEALSQAKEHRSGLRSRLQVLAELERKMEGVGAGVRALLERKAGHPDDPAMATVCGMVGNLFEADVEHAHVLEAAIGDMDQTLVVSDSHAFLSDKSLYDRLPGRLTTLFLDRLPPIINEYEFTELPVGAVHAISLAHFDLQYERLAKHLLGKTIVVETLDDALAMARQDDSGRRFVTRAGEVVEPTGVILLGPPSSRAGLIARKSERRDLGAQLEKVEEELRGIEGELNRSGAAAAHLKEVLEDLRSALYESNKAKVEAGAALQSVTEAVNRLTREQPLIAGEAAAIEHQLSEARRKVSESEETAGRLEQENTQREQTVADCNRHIEELSLERDRARHELTEARVAAAKLATKRASLADTINHLRHGIHTADEAIAVADNERVEGRRRIEESTEAIRSASERLEALAADAERLDAGVIQLRRRREMARLESEQLAAQTRSLRTRLEEVEARLHRVQLELQEAVVKRNELSARTREELGIDLAETYRTYDPGEQNWEQVEAEIADLRQKISRLGNVNLDAISEQAELEQREQFLTSQRQDLDESRKQLEELIRMLDAESVERFATSFETIRNNFRELFRKLFGGGKADIVLENPDDILESGIEIVAKPPGKEPQRISLMSGGEKTMTAIALLMSIFRSRPSPLAVLDEVDAALDEANNMRFNEIVKEFLDRSQFIIVTHSKRTMSISEHLYGVTMQEPGVSARVSVKFEDERSAVA